MEISKFDLAVIESLSRAGPTEWWSTRLVIDNLPDDEIDRIWKEDGFREDWSIHKKRKSIASYRAGSKLVSMVRRGLLVKRKCPWFPTKTQWRLGPKSDELKEQGLIPE